MYAYIFVLLAAVAALRVSQKNADRTVHRANIFIKMVVHFFVYSIRYMVYYFYCYGMGLIFFLFTTRVNVY